MVDMAVRILLILVSLRLIWLQYSASKEKKQTSANSTVFSARYTRVWRGAAHDWIMNPEDMREFQDFFGDTVAMIAKAQRSQPL